jgi:hypothetical protein
MFMTGLFSGLSTGNAIGSSAGMQVIGVGPWELEVPSDWLEKKTDRSGYLEATNGTVGCYLKALTYRQPDRSAEQIADDIQAIHERAAKGNWQVIVRLLAELTHSV